MEPTEENVRAWQEAHAPQQRAAPGLPAVVRERLPAVERRHVLHLGCGTGDETADLAELGAFVTAVDPSAQDLEQARAKTPNAAFVHAALDGLPLELLRGRFQLAYAARGALVEVQDVEAFAQGIAAALRPRGYLLHHDDHPVVHRLDHVLNWRGDYFDGRAVQLGELVTALAQAGLTVRRLEELPPSDERRRRDRRAPGEIVLVALRPG